MTDWIDLGENLDHDPEATLARGDLGALNRLTSSNLHLHKDSLLKHTTILGGTGSGKTVLGKVILEELALAGVPSIVIDVQGDLARLAQPPGGGGKVDAMKTKAWSENVEPRIWTPASEGGLPISLSPFHFGPANHLEDQTSSIDRMARGLTSILGYRVGKPAGKKIQAHLTEHISSLAETDEQP